MKPSFLLLVILISLSSCVTNKKTTYLQHELPPGEATVPTPPPYRVQVNDNLFVRIVTPDPQWSDMFNITPQTGSIYAGSEMMADLYSYPVRNDGSIDLPYLGDIQVEGKTLTEVRVAVEEVLLGFLADAAVTVRLVNNYVSLLGDVKSPGRYPIYKEHLNIFQALAMAGDLDEYSDRRYVQIIRQKGTTTTQASFDLTQRDILSSEYFYVMPNDVIYARPMRGKFFKMNAFPYSVALSTVTTFILILNFVK